MVLYKPSFWDRNLDSVHNSELRNWESAQSGFLYYYYGYRSATGKEMQSICWSTVSTNFLELSFWDRNMDSIVGICSVIFDQDSINNFKLKSFPLKGVYVLHYMLALQQSVYEYLNIHKTRGSNQYFTRGPTSVAKFSIQ